MVEQRGVVRCLSKNSQEKFNPNHGDQVHFRFVSFRSETQNGHFSFSTILTQQADHDLFSSRRFNHKNGKTVHFSFIGRYKFSDDELAVRLRDIQANTETVELLSSCHRERHSGNELTPAKPQESCIPVQV